MITSAQQQEFINDVTAKDPDSKGTVEGLIKRGHIPMIIVRDHIIFKEWWVICKTTGRSSHLIDSEVGEKYGLSAKQIERIRKRMIKKGT